MKSRKKILSTIAIFVLAFEIIIDSSIPVMAASVSEMAGDCSCTASLGADNYGATAYTSASKMTYCSVSLTYSFYYTDSNGRACLETLSNSDRGTRDISSRINSYGSNPRKIFASSYHTVNYGSHSWTKGLND